MGLLDKGLERRRQRASEFVEQHLQPGEAVVALLPWSVFDPEEEVGAGERINRRLNVAAAATAAAGQPRGLAVTGERLLVFDYPAPLPPGKAAGHLAKAMFKGGFESLQEPPERLAAAYPRAGVTVRDWAEDGKLNRELELGLPEGETLRLKIGKAFWDEADSVVGALGGAP